MRVRGAISGCGGRSAHAAIAVGQSAAFRGRRLRELAEEAHTVSSITINLNQSHLRELAEEEGRLIGPAEDEGVSTHDNAAVGRE